MRRLTDSDLYLVQRSWGHSMPKSGKATINRRVQEVSRLLLAGAEFAEIRQYASDHGWRISDRQVHRYMAAAYEGLATTTDRTRKQLLGRHLMQRRALYARALKSGDLKTALQILRDEADLEALYPPSRQEITGRDGEPLQVEHEARMRVDGIRRLLDEPEYLDYLRQRAMGADTGPLRADGEPGALANGSPSRAR